MPLTLIQPLSLRVLSRLEAALLEECDPWLRDDLRIAKLTVLYAARGDAVLCSPHVLASYNVLGLHPNKVWPAIEARRRALGPLDIAPQVLEKKPPQSVKLWSEKESGARAANSRAGEAIDLRDHPTTVPMATASIAALYPNPDAPSSAKKRSFTYQEWLDIVRHSYVRPAVRRATLNALTARGPWPGGDGPANGVICVAFDAMAVGDKYGDGICHRRTAQRRVKLACDLKYWRMVHKFNRWLNCPKCGTERTTAICPNEQCKHRGRSRNRDGSTNTKEFCRPYEFEIDIERFLTEAPPKYARHFCARTWKEHKAAAKRGEHPNVTEMPARKPVQPNQSPDQPTPSRPPTPARTDEPVRKTAEHQREERREKRAEPKMSKTESAKFIAQVEALQLGRTRHVEQTGGYAYELRPGDPRYRAPMKWAEAFLLTCKTWKRLPEVVSEALAYWGYATEKDE